MNPLIVIYCLECKWDASADHHTQTELDVLTTEHELITEHEIGSVWIPRDRSVLKPMA
jgi:hypothetical protein